ncbi:hypothetical protein [Kocuria sp.]|uniref:hypothetical protein n=1 Tax=Kocuria sp. TaxID=1871328 RepID=UPI0026DD5C2C|nr:hypothetical protein [Kocuria sp.]MDO4917911.1 hypothetical protein [Kocuria sp.]
MFLGLTAGCRATDLAHNGAMDSLATWPAPVTVDDRGFDAAAMRQLGRAPSPSAGKGGAGSGTAEGAAGTAAAAKPTLAERLTASLLLVIPVVTAVVVVLSALRWSDTHQGLWLGVIAVVLVLAAVSWVSVLRRSFAKAQGHLAARLPGVVGHGVGIVRELEVESPFDENGVSDTVTAHLTLRVNPTQGPAFTGYVDTVYRVADAEKLEVGVHGPVRYLRSDPEATVTVETRLDEEKVQRIYRAAAMN